MMLGILNRSLPSRLIYTMEGFWKLGDELRGQQKISEDNKWLMMTSKLAEIANAKAERRNNLDLSKSSTLQIMSNEKVGFEEDNKFDSLSFNQLNLDCKMNDFAGMNGFRSGFRSGLYGMNTMYLKTNNNTFTNNNINTFKLNNMSNKNANTAKTKEANNNSNSNSNNNGNNNNSANVSPDKRFKTLPSAEMLPRNEVLGGYIFVCNNDTMQEDLKRHLFGMYLSIFFLYF